VTAPITRYQQFSANEDALASIKRWQNLAGRTPTFHAHRATTTSTAFTFSDDVIVADTTAGDITLTLPVASTNQGRRFTAKKLVAGNDVIVAADGSELIDGAADVTLTTVASSVTVQSVGDGWIVVAQA
jgi:hypothetical protein